MSVVNTPRPQDPAKFRRYRERMKAKGLKEIRLWVPDLDAPGARDELAAEIARINAANARDPWINAFEDQIWSDIEDSLQPNKANADAGGALL